MLKILNWFGKKDKIQSKLDIRPDVLKLSKLKGWQEYRRGLENRKYGLVYDYYSCCLTFDSGEILHLNCEENLFLNEFRLKLNKDNLEADRLKALNRLKSIVNDSN